MLSVPRGVYTCWSSRVYRFRLLRDRPMASPRDSGRNLRLESLGDRAGLHRDHLGEVAQVRTLEASASEVGQYSAAYQALIDLVFTAPGAAEWLNGLRLRVA